VAAAACAWLRLRRLGVRVLGPVFYYDVIRSARGGQPIAFRCLYGCMLVFVLFWVYWSWFPGLDLSSFLRGRSITLVERSQFAGSFFTAFMVVQFAVALLVSQQ
jgi:hypothetical protein